MEEERGRRKRQERQREKMEPGQREREEEQGIVLPELAKQNFRQCGANISVNEH